MSDGDTDGCDWDVDGAIHFALFSVLFTSVVGIRFAFFARGGGLEVSYLAYFLQEAPENEAEDAGLDGGLHLISIYRRNCFLKME